MKKLFVLTLVLGIVATVSANLLTNAGIETASDPIDSSGAADWIQVGATIRSNVIARTGQWSFEQTANGANGSYPRLYQNVYGLTGGQDYIQQSWTYAAQVASPGQHFYFDIIYYDSFDTQLDRFNTHVNNTVPGVWQSHTFTTSAPAGTARALVGFGTSDHTLGTLDVVYTDDVAFTAVPEPATMALLALGSLTLIRRKQD